MPRRAARRRPAGADAAARLAPRGARRRRRRPRPARRPGPLALGPRRDRGGRSRSSSARSRSAAAAVRGPGGDRRRARRGRARPTGARIAASTTLLAAIDPSPVVELNRAVAVAMADGPGGAGADPAIDGLDATTRAALAGAPAALLVHAHVRRADHRPTPSPARPASEPAALHATGTRRQCPADDACRASAAVAQTARPAGAPGSARSGVAGWARALAS